VQLNDRKQRLATLQESREEAELTTESDLLATFELSYSQLSEENQKRWRVLGVFPASFASSAASAMWELKENETAKLLGLFRRYSLLEFDETPGRYSLHDLLTDFALSQIDDGERLEAYIVHTVYFAELLHKVGQFYLKGGENIFTALKLYDLEWINVEFGQRNAAKYLETHKQMAKVCNRYAWQGSINSLRLTTKNRIEWLEDALRASQVLKNRRAEGAHLSNLGIAYKDLGDAKKAIEFHEQSLKIKMEIGNRRGEGNTLGNLGVAYAALPSVSIIVRQLLPII
jgi:tetratricopeptide (TPR) repeat protein